jgi:hypothetical protein
LREVPQGEGSDIGRSLPCWEAGPMEVGAKLALSQSQCYEAVLQMAEKLHVGFRCYYKVNCR